MVKAYNAGDPGSIPESGRSPGEGNGNPLQYSCLEDPMDGEAWQATIHGGHKESDMTERLHFLFSDSFQAQEGNIYSVPQLHIKITFFNMTFTKQL